MGWLLTQIWNLLGMGGSVEVTVPTVLQTLEFSLSTRRTLEFSLSTRRTLEFTL